MQTCKFSSLKEGDRFQVKRTTSLLTKKSDLVSNAVTDAGVRMMFKLNEEVIKIEG